MAGLRKLMVVLGLVAFTTFGLAGCGGDDEGTAEELGKSVDGAVEDASKAADELKE